MQERRKHPRLRVFKSAKLILGKSAVYDCVVHDLTNVGARIGIPNANHLPEKLSILFDRGRISRSCRFVWRKLTGAGVELR
jgi:hypothetical protein